MTNELSTLNVHQEQDQEQEQSGSRPSMLSREAAMRLDILHNKIDPPTKDTGWTINRDDAPTLAEREGLERRSHALAMSMAPSTKVQLFARLTTFYAGYPNIGRDGETSAEEMVSVAIATLWGLPDWAVRDACLAALRGATDPRYVPNASQLHDLAMDAMAPFRREQDKISRVLGAKPIYKRPPQERIDAAVQDWEVNLRPKMTGLTPEEQKEEDERKERQREQFVDSSKRFVERQKREAGIEDDNPMGPELRRYLAKMAADIAERGGVENDDHGQDDGRGGGTT
jgi:hypothetical protein